MATQTEQNVEAAIERLRSRPAFVDGIAQVDMSDVHAVLAEVERLRAERDDFEGRYETAHANYMHALNVIYRLERR